MHFFSTPVSSPLLIALTAFYGICSAITSFNACITQAKQIGYLAKNKAYVPVWTGSFAILLWATWTAIFLLSWWYALALFVIKVSLNELSLLKHIGALLLRPMAVEETADAVDTAKWAADDIKTMNRDWTSQIKTMNRDLKNKAHTSHG